MIRACTRSGRTARGERGELIDFLIDYTDGTLSPQVRWEFDRHLGVCPSCRAYHDSCRRSVGIARRTLSAEEAERAAARVLQRLVRVIIEARNRRL